MRILHIVITALIFFQVPTAAATTPPPIDEILAFAPERQFEYLAKASPEILEYYYRNSEEFVRLLLEIASQENGASELAMYQLNWYLLQLSMFPCTPGFIALTKTELIDQKLSQIITLPNFDIKVRRGAILAHARLFPPNEFLLQYYESEIEKNNLNDRGMIENILIAFSQYQSKLGIELPAAVGKKLPSLLHHHSDGVRFEALSMLIDRRGLDYLPDLFELLESGSYRPNERIVLSILLLDTTQGTVDRLRNISNQSNNGGMKKMIDRSILPANIERLRKNREAKRMQADQKNAAHYCDR